MIKLLDCTIRDGGYINDWGFSEDFGKALYRATSDSGCAFVEIGFFNPKPKESAPWCNCSADLIRRIKSARPGGAGIAIMIDYGSCPLESIPDAHDYPADLIRVATPKGERKAATEFAAALTRKGYKTTVNYMAITEYTNEEILDLLTIINRHRDQVEYFYVADSFGSLLPARARAIFTTLRFGTQAKLGFHPHNNLQLAFANSLEAIDAGLEIVDGSIYGMGRGAGNLFLEAALAYLEQRDRSFNLLPVLQFADLFVDALKADYSWGYSLPQLISGVLSCHPNFPTNLLEEKQYTADEIYHLLQRIEPAARSRYSPSTLAELKRLYAQNELAQAEHRTSTALQALLARKRRVLLLAGGPSVHRHEPALRQLAAKDDVLVVSINHPQPVVPANAVLFANRRRLLQHYPQLTKSMPVILTQSIHADAIKDFELADVSRVNISSVFKAAPSPFPALVPTNSATEAILTFHSLGCREILIAGLDGFSLTGEANYYNEKYDTRIAQDEAVKRNQAISDELKICRELLAREGGRFAIITPTRFTDYQEPLS